MEKDTMYCALPHLVDGATGNVLPPETLVEIIMSQNKLCGCSYKILPVTEEGTEKCIDILTKNTTVTKVTIKDKVKGILEVYSIHPQTGELVMTKNYARVIKLNLNKTNSRNWEDDNVEC